MTYFETKRTVNLAGWGWNAHGDPGHACGGALQRSKIGPLNSGVAPTEPNIDRPARPRHGHGSLLENDV